MPRAAALASGAGSKPVVPITTCTPASTHASALSSAVSGRVKSTTTSQSPRIVGQRRVERRVGAAGELQVVGRLDGRADRLAQPPGGAGDADPDHCTHAASASVGDTGSSAARKTRLVGADAGGAQALGRVQLARPAPRRRRA